MRSPKSYKEYVIGLCLYRALSCVTHNGCTVTKLTNTCFFLMKQKGPKYRLISANKFYHVICCDNLFSFLRPKFLLSPKTRGCKLMQIFATVRNISNNQIYTLSAFLHLAPLCETFQSPVCIQVKI